MDTYADGTPSIISVLRPKRSSDWQELPCDKHFRMGYPSRSFLHKSGLMAISAVEVINDGKIDKGPEYHISISRHSAAGPCRCDSQAAKWVLRQFGMDGAEEDNHAPHGIVRNFWRPVATSLIGLECECKAEEPAIREDKGDFTWRP